MGLDGVTEEILAAGRSKAEAHIAEAEAERERLFSGAREKARQLKRERMLEAGRAVAQLRVRELAAAELEVKRARLAMERDLLEAAARGAREKVAAMPPPEDELLLLSLLRRVQGPGLRMYSAKRNEPFLRRTAAIPYAGNVSCLGGLVLESSDGTVRMDHTYDTILRDTVERMTRELYGILFAR